MFITTIQVKNYRNYINQTITLSEGVNVFSGGNAQGKTNLLESVYLCSIAKSPRTNKDKDLIYYDADCAYVKVVVKKIYGCDTIEVFISKTDKKRIKINGMPLSKTGELMGALNTVFFSPDELRIIKDGPSERRRFVDIAICQLSKPYFYTLTRYLKILAQRNKLLKSKKLDGLEIWNAQLCREGAKIIRTRRGFVRKLLEQAKTTHHYLTSGDEEFFIEYEGIEGETISEIEANFLLELEKAKEKELALGYTQSGPQKDDFVIKCNGIDIRSFGSQGQQRTAALSLKLAELEIFKSETGEYPILLLDDVFSELDSNRRQKLINRLFSVQSIITCTNIDSFLLNDVSNITSFNIENGKIKR